MMSAPPPPSPAPTRACSSSTAAGSAARARPGADATSSSTPPPPPPPTRLSSPRCPRSPKRATSTASGRGPSSSSSPLPISSPSRDLPDAELYLWRSDEQPTPQWARKEVKLPRELCWESCKHPFTADTSFYFSGPPGTDTFCWVDLLRGIVLCSNPADQEDDDAPVAFSFVRFPDECAAFDMLSHPYRPHMREFRSVAGVGGAIKLVALLGVLEGSDPDQYRLTAWTLSGPDLKDWRRDGSFLMDDLWATDEYRGLSGLPPCAPICPVLSLSAPEVVYAVVNHLEARDIRHGSVGVETEPDFKCQYVLGLDIRSNKIVSVGSRLRPDIMELRPSLRATDFCASMQGAPLRGAHGD
ncbi:hypothetical protein BS78_09G012500 [Paspalum vaginatum]|nr:hypothetical protein BS78_09G012500 [Paspalum vaginatum]